MIRDHGSYISVSSLMLLIRPSKGMECILLSQNILELSVVTNMLDNSKLHVCVSNVFVDVISSM